MIFCRLRLHAWRWFPGYRVGGQVRCKRCGTPQP